MRFWKDKEGNKLTFKEFMKRWRDGLDGITPLQRTKTQIIATSISMLGIFLGLIITIIAYKQLWWVAIILLGALINTGVQYLGLSQTANNLKEHEVNCDEMSLEDLMSEDDVVMVVDGEEQKGMSEGVIKIEDHLEELNEEGGKK